ncbi:MAG: type IV pilus twitching motility protein PilT [Candidatus Omnitrophica bacterium]|nr:type IV pilus twitching motility protein PilT [Candidatus Omnitrophota bacterium]MBU4303901.1 type IV pilus twitching motility protein PilT [Candidatus Omnitrophota bacterium]MBU4418730.1 type IV pilus twitching motility protein PilT [Candidatus Omnitrophota bacterium]MBU4468078.1 type IV pilus twitching motility protein PilT [Candidatus Omnitrophota bacterium]MCG2707853.1 type IV pilus twitching motility protein PilT [Candidatus Omnitrophota bacterium]
MEIRDLLLMCIEKNASDLHVTESEPPILRIDGRLVRTNLETLNKQDLKKMLYSVLSNAQKEVFEREMELDFSLALPGLDRFRVNIHLQKGSVEGAFRRIPIEIPTVEKLGLPQIITDLARKPNGLVLITGPTGMGKTTTLAAMIDLINSERECLITCIEDPIEFIYANKKSIIKQREVYADTHSFAQALRHALRQDPNVIVVGEMRDLETISTALTAAETGHLVLATLHTPDAPQTVSRIIDVFPPHQQQQVKLQLADCLQGVVSQLLLPHALGKGRVLATEIMVATPSIRNLIREQQIEQIPTAMQTGLQYGMNTMDSCLKTLMQRGLITLDVAMSKTRNKEEFKQL